MAAESTITANARTEFGKGPNRRLRAKGLVPGVVYQPGGPSIPFSADSHELFMLLKRGHGRREVVEIVIDGAPPIAAIFKEWQLDPVRDDVRHVDFAQIDRSDIDRINAEQHAEEERKAAEREEQDAAAAANIISEADLVTSSDDAGAAPSEDAEERGVIIAELKLFAFVVCSHGVYRIADGLEDVMVKCFRILARWLVTGGSRNGNRPKPETMRIPFPNNVLLEF